MRAEADLPLAEQRANERLRRVRHARLRREVQMLPEADNLLAGLPLRLRIERRVADEHLVEQHAEAPEVQRVVVPAKYTKRVRGSRCLHTKTCLKHPQIRQAFSIHPLLVGGNPFDTTSIYALIHYLEREWGVFFCMGGTGKIISCGFS